MNMLAQMHTNAEKALLEAYDRSIAELPGDSAVALKRDNAVEVLKAGLPTKRVETWHYTDLRRLLSSIPDSAAVEPAKPLDTVLAGSSLLTVVNGTATGNAANIDGVTIERVADALQDGKLAATLDLAGDDDAIGALNAAFVKDGWSVTIADGVEPEAAIELQSVQDGGQSHIRFPVTVGNGAKATIVERHAGKGQGLSTAISNLVVGDDAEVLWLIVQEEPEAATYLGQFNATIGKNSTLTVFVMNAGGKLVRQEIRVIAKGEGSDFQLRGVNLLAGDTHTDVTMVLDHSVPNTTSRELVRNIVTGRARGVFQGRINVHQVAQKTDAKMACNTLLLSDDGEFSSKPELEIFADDVACGHGATVTEIDRNHLFYLMARGIDEKSGRGLLVKAFLAEVIEELEVEPVIEALEARLDAWFSAHG